MGIHSLLEGRPSSWRRASGIGAGALLVSAPTAAVLVDEQPVSAYNLITVTSTADSGPGSLRAALAAAVDGDGINLDAIAGSTILIDSPLQWNTASNIVSLSGGVTIDASTATDASHIFHVSGAGGHVISGITLQNANDGAIVCAGDAAVDITLVHTEVLLNSKTTVSGAGIDMDGCGDLTLSYYTRVSNNSGAGVAMNNSGAFTMTSYTYVDNNINATSTGGGIRLVGNNGDVSIIDAEIANNEASGNGGGIYLYGVTGSVTIDATYLGRNVSGGSGGGAYLYLGATTAVTISNTNVTGNEAEWGGSGLHLNQMYVPAVLDRVRVDGNIVGNGNNNGAGVLLGEKAVGVGPSVIRNSAFTNNTGAYAGGGLFFYTSVNVYNSTIAGNTAGACAGIFGPSSAVASALDLTFVTVSGNSSGVCISGPTNMVGTVIAGNVGLDINGNGTITGDHDAFGPFTSHTDATTNSITNVLNPGLGTLQLNGGSTLSKLPASTSVLVDAGPTTWTPFSGDAFDQRGTGYPRISNSRSDIGAIERASSPSPSSSTTSSTSTSSTTSSSSTSTTTSTSTSTTSTSIAPTTTIDVGPGQPATPSGGRPLTLPPGSAATIDPDGTVTPATIEATSPGSIAFGSQPLSVELSGGHVASGTTIEFAAGGQFTATGRGFQPGSTVSLWIQTPAIRMATVVVDPDGTFTAPVVVPSELPVGDFTIQVQGVGSDGSHRALGVGVSIVSSSALPVTGRDLVGTIGLGGSLLLAGGMAALASRRAQRPIGRHFR